MFSKNTKNEFLEFKVFKFKLTPFFSLPPPLSLQISLFPSSFSPPFYFFYLFRLSSNPLSSFSQFFFSFLFLSISSDPLTSFSFLQSSLTFFPPLSSFSLNPLFLDFFVQFKL